MGHNTRRLRDGRTVAVHHNAGVRKVCGCAHRVWAKCPHPWHLNFRWRGKDYRLSLDRHLGKRIESRTEAEGEADTIRAAIRAGTFDAPPLPVSIPSRTSVSLESDAAVTPGVTLRSAVQDYIKDFVSSPLRRTTATAEMKRLINAWLVSPLSDGSTLADRPLATITATDITRVVDVRHSREKVRGDKAGRVGTNRQLTRLRHFYGWCIRRGLVTASPFSDQPGLPGVQFAKGVEKGRRRRLQEGEEEKLLKRANPHLRALITAALDSACRVGELLNLTFGDVDEQRGLLTIRSEVAKTNTQRVVPLTTRVKALIAMRRTAPDGKEHDASKFVFGNAVGERVKDVKTAWLACCRRAGVNDLHFHDLRREGASRLLEAGVALHVVSAWLGHTSIAQTATYLTINAPQLDEARAKLEAAQAQAARPASEQTTDTSITAQSAPSDSACQNLASSDEPPSEPDSSPSVTTSVH